MMAHSGFEREISAIRAAGRDADAAIKAVSNELIDVLYWVLLIAHDMKIDLPAAFDRKMKQNEAKYPVSKAKGSHAKYTEL